MSKDIFRTGSTRLLTCIWWMFTLLMLSCYTANLSAFLTVNRLESSFSMPEDLLQTRLSYGTVERGATFHFMKERYRAVWEGMETVSSNAAGLDRVRRGNFVMFMESPRLEYEVAKDCGITQVGKLLNNRYYALGLQSSQS